MNYTKPSIIAVLAMALWLLADYPLVGQALIFVYVVLFWRKVTSRELLKIFLVTLGIVFVAVTIRNYQATIAFAIYAYALLIAVAITLVKELRRDRVYALRRQREEDNA